MNVQVIGEILQDFQVLTVLPASLVICFALFFVRKSNSKKPIPNETLEKRIYSYKSGSLVDYFRIDETLSETSVVEKNQGCLDLVKLNYLNLLNNRDLRREAEFSIRKYGVGSCGPRGFYGTIDIHLMLEEQLAKFMQMEEAVLYSYGFSTISSAIGAYCRKSDIIFCDEKISFCATQGMLAAKSKVIYFKHNNAEDLEIKLKEYEIMEQQNKKLFRKFLLVEGLYKATGKLCPLPQLMKLRQKYKLRIFIDESVSFGTLGETGRGITEHFKVDRSDVDMIMASLEGAIGSVAGFCTGSAFIIEHQRLAGIGYVFSASLPPFLSHTSICALKMFDENPSMLKKLHYVSLKVNQALNEIDPENCVIINDPDSPLKVITCTSPGKIRNIYNKCIERNLLVFLADDSIAFNVNITLEQCDIDRISKTLKDAFRQCNDS